eukprot:NODE_11_length_5645_cov_23.831279_g9_i0.p1 GENE.NODE_11_length_5645_cov_23.831279_g9_i0~~NODE_11_length_5645_cov_23.831279_g9_i0.p1  ORF type:complete len:1855 (-),score=527.99 NODE_11_length_5645_cov_23.831279_g9_i0:79-5007(-)
MGLCYMCYPRNAGLIHRADLDEKASKAPSAGLPPHAHGTRALQGGNLLLQNQQFLADFADQLKPTNTWLPPTETLKLLPYQAMLGIPLAITLHGAAAAQALPLLQDNSMEKAFEYMYTATNDNEAFQCIETWVFGRSTFKQDTEYRRDYHTLWNEVLSYYICHFIDSIQALTETESTELSEYIQLQSETLRPSRFAQFMNLVGALHQSMEGSFANDWLHTTPNAHRPMLLVIWPPQHLKALHGIGQLQLPGASLAWEYIWTFTIAYLNMLTGLVESAETAQFVYTHLEKQSQVSFVRWDSLWQFLATHTSYYVQDEIPPTLELYTKAVLRLIANTVQYSDTSLTLMLSQEARYDPLGILFRFYGSPASPALMGQVFKTMAAFASRHEVALQLWRTLESLEVLQKVGVPSNSGMRHQLSVEAKNFKYPETVGYVELLNQLFKHLQSLMPCRDLPPFAPFLKFVTTEVFLPFAERRYADMEEMWVVAAACLELMAQVLQDYQPDKAHFEDKMDISNAHKTSFGFSTLAAPASERNVISDASQCGFWLMKTLLQADSLLTRVLRTLHEVSKVAAGAEERCVHHTLKIMECMLLKQTAFIEASRQALQHRSGEPHLFTLLDDTLMALSCETVSGPSNPIVELAYYISSPSYKLRNSAIKVLTLLAGSHQNITILFRRFGKVTQMLQLFVNAFTEEERVGGAAGELSVRAHLVQLILTVLDNRIKSPNMAHFLCGFDLDNPSAFTDAPISSSPSHPSNCLEVMLSSLKDSRFHTNHPHLAQLYCKAVLRLAEHPEMTEAVMSRLCAVDYFINGIHIITRSKEAIAKTSSAELLTCILNQHAALLKTIALFLHTAAHKHTQFSTSHSYVRSLVVTLFHTSGGALMDGPSDPSYPPLTLGGDEYTPPGQQPLFMEDCLQTLDFPHFLEQHPLPSILPTTHTQLEVFGALGHSQAFQRSADGVPEFNIRKLDQELQNILFAAQHHSATHSDGSLQFHRSEAEHILRRALQANHCYRLFDAINQAVAGWAEVVEITMFKFYSLIAHDNMQHVLFTILHRVLQTLCAYPSATPTAQVATVQATLARTAATLITKFREDYNPFLLFSGTSGARLSSRECGELLKVILHSILKEEARTTPRFRSNCYVVLSNFLEYTQRSPDSFSGCKVESPQDNDKLASLDAIFLVAPALLNVLTRDALEQTDGYRAVAWATLDTLVRYDASGRLLHLMQSPVCTLQQAMDSLNQMDEQLCDVLDPQCGQANILHVYESLLSFLTSVAAGPSGAQALHEQQGVLARLTSMAALRRVREILPQAGILDHNPLTCASSVRERCGSVILPALHLMGAVFQRLHQNTAVAALVADFVSHHSKVFKYLLRQPTLEIDTPSLREVLATTSVLNLLASHRAILAAKVGLGVVKKFGLLAVLGLFARNEFWQPNATIPLDDLDTQRAALQEQEVLTHRIVRNIIEVCCKTCGALKMNDPDDGGLTPSLLFDISMADFMPDGSVRPRESLALLLHVLKGRMDSLTHNQRRIADWENRLKTAHNPPPPMALTLHEQQTTSVARHSPNEYAECTMVNDTITCTLESTMLLFYHHLNIPRSEKRPAREADDLRSDAYRNLKPIMDAVLLVTADSHPEPRTDFLAGICERVADLVL